MGDDLKVEYLLLRIREKLNNDKIKLWLPPYHTDETTDSSESSQAIEDLANNYSALLKIDKNICITALKELQAHAIDKLHDKEVYKDTGVAVIKVKLSGWNPPNNSQSKILSFHIHLSSLGNTLHEMVSEKINIPREKIKLISSGKVLNNKMTLEAQGVKHGIQIMAVILSPNSSDLQEYESQIRMLEKMKDDVKILTNGLDSNSENYLQIADQSGRSLTLPPEERKALISAMALHEKGRAALKKDEYAMALVFFLEADKEFSVCNSTLLNSVDNYGLLNLDIAWCYLCLKNVTQLPDAEKRLQICESKFKFSYGKNLERLVALKGSSGNETALLMRLHLLQGIVLFHQNKYEEARRMLHEAQRELLSLKVDDSSLCMLIELGLTAAEARIGLRATKGCVNSALDYIHCKRQEREEIRRKEKLKRKRESLGFCKDGQQYVDLDLVNHLEAMGFSNGMAVEALRHSNNSIDEAITLIEQDPDLLRSGILNKRDNPLYKELLEQITSFGYDPEMAIRALMKNHGNLQQAVEELIKYNGIISAFDELDPNRPSSSDSESRVNRLKKEMEAYNRFSEGMSNNIDDHLDLTLEQEEQFLIQYLSLLN